MPGLLHSQGTAPVMLSLGALNSRLQAPDRSNKLTTDHHLLRTSNLFFDYDFAILRVPVAYREQSYCF